MPDNSIISDHKALQQGQAATLSSHLTTQALLRELGTNSTLWIKSFAMNMTLAKLSEAILIHL